TKTSEGRRRGFLTATPSRAPTGRGTISLSLNLDRGLRLTIATLQRAVPKSMQPIQSVSRLAFNRLMLPPLRQPIRLPVFLLILSRTTRSRLPHGPEQPAEARCRERRAA